MAALPVAAQANTRATGSVYSVPLMSYSSLLCTMQSGGCLLPLREPAPVVEVPAPPVDVAAPAAVKKGGSSLLPILLGVGLLLGGALAFSGGGGNGGGNQSNGAN